LFVIDEIGKMECLAQGFVVAVRRLLALSRPVLATVALSGQGLIEEVKRDPRARLVHLTRGNRDGLPAEVARMAQEALV
jgi:nucleoside-triphosphatase